VARDTAARACGIQILKLAKAGNEFDVTPGWAVIGTHIAPEKIGQGIGRALFAATYIQAVDQQVPCIDATTGAQNLQGLGYYAAMGFVPYNQDERRIRTCLKPG
jgi:GNAT superfamily N-acetyltransferase